MSDLDENASQPSSAHPTTRHAGEAAEENDVITFRSASTGFAFDNAEVFDAPDFVDWMILRILAVMSAVSLCPVVLNSPDPNAIA